MRKLFSILFLLVVFGGGVGDSYGQFDPALEDHMKCWRVVDSNPRAIAYANLYLSQLQDIEKGCKINKKALEFCAPAEKCLVDPLTGAEKCPTIADGPNPGDRLCYTLSCPAMEPFRIRAKDQFGQRELRVSAKPSKICTPATKELVTPCGLIPGSNICGGECPTGLQCRPAATAPCVCQ